MRCYSHDHERNDCWLKKLGNPECKVLCQLAEQDTPDAER